MVRLVEKEEASNILQPHISIIQKALLESLRQLNNALDVIDVNLNNRAKTSTLHSIAVEKLKRAFSEIDGLQLVQKYQSLQIVFDGKLAGRIKKLNKNNFTANSNTTRNSLIESQQLKLFNLPPITFIDLGYKVDPTWTSYDQLLIVCRLKDELVWELPFDDYNDDSFNLTIKVTPVIPKPIEPEKLIKVRKSNGKG